MAGVPDKALVQVGRFPDGIDVVSDLTSPQRDDAGNTTVARKLENVDIDNAGRAKLRRGQETIDDAEAHSLFNFNDNFLLAWVAQEYRAYRKAGTTIELDTVLYAGMLDRFVTATTDDFDVYASNGTTEFHKRIASDLSVHPFWLDTPAPADVSAASAGGLAAGKYEVSVTCVDSDGRESGASDPVVVTLTEGQGIAVVFPVAPEDAARWRVYRSTANGGEGEDASVLYLCADLPTLVTETTLAETTLGGTCKTLWMQPIPPCTLIRYGFGRNFAAALDGIVWSEPGRPGLMNATGNHVGMYGGCRMLELLGEGGDAAGAFASDTRRTYWFAGADPKTWRQRIVYPHPAVPGTSVLVSGTVMGLETAEPVAVWMASNGTWLMGLPGGQIVPIRENQVALPVDADRGAAAFFEHGGVKQIVTTLLGGNANGNNSAMSDSADATIRRHGIEIE